MTDVTSITHNVYSDSTEKPWWNEARNLADAIVSVASFPITIKGKVIGALTMSSDFKDVFNSEEIELMEELAGDISRY